MSGNAKISDKSIVCVVDDDFSVRDSTQRLIRSFGFRAEAFASAEEFESAGYLEEAACLILDVQMPGMSGIELQRRLASRRCEIPIIFITAYENDVVRAQAIREGALAFLAKPFSEEVLLDAIHMAFHSQMTTSQNTRNV